MGKKVFMLLTNPFKPDPRVYKEAKTLIDLGFDVTVIAWDREGTYPSDEIVGKIRVHRIRVKSKYASLRDFFFKIPIFYLKAFRYIVKNSDGLYAIHANDFDTAPLAFFLSRLLNVRFVYDIHDLYYTRISLMKEKETEGTLRRILRVSEIFLARLSDSVITVSRSVGGKQEGIKEFLVREGLSPDKVHVIWNTPELESFPRIHRDSRNMMVVGYIGSLRSVFNFIPLFELAERNRSIKILFVGGGPSKEAVEELLSTKYPHVDFEFIDNVEYRKVPSYYALCDVTYSVYPLTENVKRAVAVKVFESVIMGIPVVVNKDTLMEDFVNLYRCGVAVGGKSWKELSEAIERVRKIVPPSGLRNIWNWKGNLRQIRKAYGLE